jgi:hypothetical protein
MSDRIAPAGLTGMPLGEALRALPLSAPPASAWPELQAALLAAQIAQPKRPSRWHLVLPIALAAGLALALLLPRVATTPTAPETTTQVSTPNTHTVAANDGAAEIAALRDQSQRLEIWLQRVADGNAPLGGQDLMAAAEVEDLIGLVDVQLASAGAQPQAAALWRQRIALLEDLGSIRTAAYGLSQAGLADTGLPAQGTADMPRNWIN